MSDRIRQFIASCWLALTGLTIAQVNQLLGFVSLVVGITYQLWKWRKEARLDAQRDRSIYRENDLNDDDDDV
jgi:hypothetical protein